MQVILDPTVTVVGHSKFIEHPVYKIPADGDDSVKLGAFAAKACYDSFGENGRANEANQAAILEHRHGSVLEHATVSLFMEGVSRALTLELNRHRTQAISQRSTRYTKEEDAAMVLEPYYAELYRRHYGEKLEWNNGDIVVPGNIETTLLGDFLGFCELSIQKYKFEVETLIELNPLKLEGFDLRKWARGKARNLLPHALETRGTYTNNHRGWRWFIEARSDKHAEPEIRRLAHHTLAALRTVAPKYYADFHIDEVYDSIPVYKPEFSKV